MGCHRICLRFLLSMRMGSLELDQRLEMGKEEMKFLLKTALVVAGVLVVTDVVILVVALNM